MNQPIRYNMFQSSNILKILTYIVERPGQEVLPGDILKSTGLSRVGIYLAINQLIEHNLITKKQHGRFVTYISNYSNPVVKQYKILINIVKLTPLLQKVYSHAKKVILFGSTSRGEDYPDSDIDLMVITNELNQSRDILPKYYFKRKINVVYTTPSEYIALEGKKGTTFGKEVDRGIVLWEEKE